MGNFKKFIEDNNESICLAADKESQYSADHNVKIKPFPEIDIIAEVTPFDCEMVYKDILTEMAENGSPFGFRNGLLIAAIPKKTPQGEMPHFEIRFGLFI